MSRQWFTQEQVERAKRLRGMGYSFQEIADRMGTSKGRIGKLAQRNWQRTKNANRPRPMDLSFYAADLTFSELKKRYRVGGAQLRKWLDEGGIKLPDRHRANARRPMPTSFATEAAGLSLDEILTRWKCGKIVALRWKIEAGLPTPRHDWHERRKPKKVVGWAERYYAERIAA